MESRKKGFEKRNHWEGQVGERNKLEQSIMACMYEKAIIESISLSTNLENCERQAEKEGNSVVKSFLLRNGMGNPEKLQLNSHLIPYIQI